MKITTKTVLLTLALFLPTVIAIVYYLLVQNMPVTDSAVFQIVIEDTDGTVYEIKRSAVSEETNAVFDLPSGKKSDIISFFCEMNTKAKSLSELPSPLVGTPCFTVTFFSYNLENKYKYYFTTDTADAYYTDSKGNAYHIESEYAEKFITTQYAVSLYKDASAPIMKLSNNVTVYPQNMTWRYRRSDSVWGDAVVKLAEKRETYPINGALNLNFPENLYPDLLEIRILDGENELYNDLYENISQLDFSENKKLSVAVTAKWYEFDDRNFWGEAFYNFIVDVTAPSEFYLGQSEIYPGEFIAITGRNVTNPQDIVFTSTPEIKFTPVFFADKEQGEGCVVALVPISYELDYSPNYTFDITYKDITTTLTLNVAEKTFKWRDYDISAEIISMTRTESSINAFNENMKLYFGYQENERYWKPAEKWLLPSKTDQVQLGIGIHRTLTANGVNYRHQGVDFKVQEGMEVYAAYDGKVIYAGTQTLSGRTVVIEHGFGLKSLYAHMSSTVVSEGDIVKAGDVLGVVGNTGFTNTVNLHFGLYIFDMPVSPYSLWFWDTDTNEAAIGKPDHGILMNW